MSRYRGPKVRICRRFGENLYGTEKCARILAKRNFAPGMHVKSFSKSVSEYGKQFLMKQKIKFIYGVTERQFRKYFEDVKSKKGVVGDLLLARLEQRLDNVIYRLGFANTRSQARQVVFHGMIFVNGKKVNIPSYKVEVGDEISVNPLKINNGYFKNQKQNVLNKKNVPVWLSLNGNDFSGKIVSLPGSDDFEANVNAQVVVEFYSK